MTREADLALVFSPEVWVEELHRHCTDHGGARVRQVVLDPHLALEEQFDVLVVSHRWPALSRGFVDSLHDRGRRVLGVFDPHEPAGRDHLGDLGVDAVVEADAGAAAFLRVVARMMEAFDAPPGPAGTETRVPVDVANRTALGRRIAVSGPAGAGATEIAVALAAAHPGAVLVDADDVAPAIAQRLGLSIEPNLRSAIDAVEFGLGALESMLLSVADFRVLTGLPNVAAWDQVRPGEVARVVERVAACAPEVVVDVAAPLEAVGPATRPRYGTARAVLAEADIVVAVGLGGPVGVTRLLRWLADVDLIVPDTPVVVVVNKAPSEAFHRAEIHEEIVRTYPAAGFAFVPDDARVTRAVWAGTPVDRSAFTRAVANVPLEVGIAAAEADAATLRDRSAGRGVLAPIGGAW